MQLWGTLVGIVAVVCAVWVIYDVWTNNKKMKDTMKIVWTVCAVIFSIITAIVYYFVGKK
jgi:ABC-type spermidine/putrescine transport system permease subunit II